MAAAYCRLHELGHAHSVEVWHEGSLAGGTYGVAMGGLFAGESMFHRVRDASKVALVYLVAHLRERGFRLFDIQQLTPHTESLGAVEISRADFLSRLAESLAPARNLWWDRHLTRRSRVIPDRGCSVGTAHGGPTLGILSAVLASFHRILIIENRSERRPSGGAQRHERHREGITTKKVCRHPLTSFRKVSRLTHFSIARARVAHPA